MGSFMDLWNALELSVGPMGLTKGKVRSRAFLRLAS
jgi:hypothetical protein